MLKVAVIGLGYWGPNLVRNFSEIPDVHLKTICDLRADRLEPFKRRYPWVTVTSRVEDVFSDPEIDAVAIATPIFTHFELVKAALEHDKHVFIEKPMAASSDQGRVLVKLARERKRVLMVDHVFLYTAAVKKMKELISSGEIGDVLYFDSVRINLGLFQKDANVVWDLAPHDLSIMDYVLDRFPVAVRATGARHAHAELENIAYVHFYFKNEMIAHFHVNWLAPVKIRQILIGGTKKMIVYNDIDPTEKIKVYDKGIDIKKDADEQGRFQTLINYRTGDVLSPKLDNIEALQLACKDFISHVQNGKTEFECDGAHGLRVVALLEAIQQSLEKNGELIELPQNL